MAKSQAVLSSKLAEFFKDYWAGKVVLTNGFDASEFLKRKGPFFAINSSKSFEPSIAKEFVDKAFLFGSGDPAGGSGLFWFYFWPNLNDQKHLSFAKLSVLTEDEISISIAHWVDSFDKFIEFENKYTKYHHEFFTEDSRGFGF